MVISFRRVSRQTKKNPENEALSHELFKIFKNSLSCDLSANDAFVMHQHTHDIHKDIGQ